MHGCKRLCLFIVFLLFRVPVDFLGLFFGHSLLFLRMDLLPDWAALVEVFVHADIAADTWLSEFHAESHIRQR